MFYEKHKIFLYKEDFEKFTEGLREALAFASNGEIAQTLGKTMEGVEEVEEAITELSASEFSDVDFDELGTR